MAHDYDPMKAVMVRLPAADREALRRLARRRRCPESVIMREAISTYVQHQEREAASAHRTAAFEGEEARRYAGEWVALSGQEVVAHGRDGVAVFHEARLKGVLVPRVIRVPDLADDQPVFGL